MKKNRTFIGIVCIIIAAVVVFGLTPVIAKLNDGKIAVVQVINKIEVGQKITKNDVIKVEVGSAGLSEKIIRDESLIVDKYAATTLLPDVNIVNEMITESIETPKGIYGSLNGTEKVMSIAIANLASSISGNIKRGDIVSIITIKEDATTEIPVELTYLKVITTTCANGVDYNEQIPKAGEPLALPTTVTFLVNEIQAKSLAAISEKGKFYITLVSRENQKKAEAFLSLQNDMLNKGGLK